MSVYLDYNSTTPVAPEALKAVTEALTDTWANPNSSHSAGQRPHDCIEKARSQVAEMINSSAEDIVFTSGGTESNNMVIDSVLQYWNHLTHADGVAMETKPHLITSNIDHDSVAKCVQRQEMESRAEVTIVAADPTTGAVRVEDVVANVRPSTMLISIMLAQNETGVLQPVGEIVKAVRQHERLTQRKNRVLIHTDAAQALGKVRVDVQELAVDYLTVVGHKFYGPRAGALYARGLGEYLKSGPRGRGAPLYPMLSGGGQERGLRPGTQNTAMIAGLGKASELVTENLDKYHTHMKTVRDYLEHKLKETFSEKVCFNGRYANSDRLPNTCNFSLVGKDLIGHRILSALKCSQVSVGAACHHHCEARPSLVLLASGVTRDVAVNALRVSVGRYTSNQDIDTFIDDLISARDVVTSNHSLDGATE